MAKKNKKKSNGGTNRLEGAEDLIEASESTEVGESAGVKPAVVETASTDTAGTEGADAEAASAEAADESSGESASSKPAKAGGGQAIDAPQAKAFRALPEDLTIIGLDTKHKKGEHPLWDKRANNPPREDLVLAMLRFGWHGAITVVKDGDMTVVDDGKQRTIAAREANRRLEESGEERRIRVVCLSPVKGEDAKKAAVMAMMNEHRTVDDMIERARKMENMLRFEASIEDVAVAFGETQQTVNNCLKTLECHSSIIKAAERGEVAPSVLVALSALSRDEQVAEFEKMQKDGRLTVTEAQRAVRRKKNGNGHEDEDRGKKISILDARKILKLHAKDELKSKLSEDAITTMAVLAGELPPNRLRGMMDALRQVGALEE